MTFGELDGDKTLLLTEPCAIDSLALTYANISAIGQERSQENDRLRICPAAVPLLYDPQVNNFFFLKLFRFLFI